METTTSKKVSKNAVIESFLGNRKAMLGLAIVLIEILICFLLPLIIKMDPFTTDVVAGFNQPPSATHILGTDDVGRDLFARLLYGGRISLTVGITATLITLSIGIPLGLIAGFYGGIPEIIIMRMADIFMSFPSMILILVLVAVVGPSTITVTVVIGVLGWTSVGKLIYGNTLSAKNKDYVLASKALGTKNSVIIFKDILPNVISPVWSMIAFRIGGAILTESSLSFLGAGVQTPQASWGNIIYAAQNLLVLTARPWVWIPPGTLVVLTVISFNFIGEGIRDALDPKSLK